MLYGLITAKTRQEVVSHEVDDVVALMLSLRRVTVDIYIDVAGCGEKLEWRRMQQKVLNCSKYILARGQPWAVYIVKTCSTHETHVIIHVPAVIKT